MMGSKANDKIGRQESPRAGLRGSSKATGFARAAIFGLALAAWAGAQPGEMRDGPHHEGPPGMEMMIPRLMRDLNLPPDQQAKLKESHLAMQKKKIQLQSD